MMDSKSPERSEREASPELEAAREEEVKVPEVRKEVPVVFSVKNPTVVQGGLLEGSYLKYYIVVQDPGRWDGRMYEVSRKYTDFLTLRNMLTTEFPGVIVPPLPEKDSVLHGAVTGVTTQVQRYLDACSRKAVLMDSSVMKAFATMHEKTWEKHVKDQKWKLPIFGLKDTWSKGVNMAGVKDVLHVVPERYIHLHAYLMNMEEGLNKVKDALEHQMAMKAETSVALDEIGQALAAFADNEKDDVLQADLRNISQHASKLGSASTEKDAKGTIEILNVVLYYINMMAALRHNLYAQKSQEANITKQQKEVQDLLKKRDQADLKGDETKKRKVSEQLEKLSLEVSTNVTRSTEASEEFSKQIAEFKQEMADEWINLLKRLAQLKVQTLLTEMTIEYQPIMCG
eukprot:TRINITY_DN17446_c1_g2_i3.p1 TRINITY_DN17446_c1_g2~~TRINITY_DN17446_c1_g2_i3.p1  ORF type:complete len:413 (+),score=127.99 TRINITY_DN17446_c1_g2_i3:41-1240(+)